MQKTSTKAGTIVIAFSFLRDCGQTAESNLIVSPLNWLRKTREIFSVTDQMEKKIFINQKQS